MIKFIVNSPTGTIEYKEFEDAENAALRIWLSMSDEGKEESEVTVEEWSDDCFAAVVWSSQNIIDSDIIPFRYQGNKYHLDLGHPEPNNAILNQIAKNRTFGMWERIQEYDSVHSTSFYSNLRPNDIIFSRMGQKIGKQVTGWEQVVGSHVQLTEVTRDMKVSRSGYSMIIRITDCCEMLGVGPGDIVNVTLRRRDVRNR